MIEESGDGERHRDGEGRHDRVQRQELGQAEGGVHRERDQGLTRHHLEGHAAGQRRRQ